MKHHRKSAYSYPELLIVVGAIAIITAVGFFMASGVNKSTEEAKLKKDVATINTALKLYQASGGSLQGITDPAVAIAKLKTEASNGAQLASLRGQLVDPRLSLRMSGVNESGPFAVWNTSSLSFEVSTTASAGIKEFVLDPNAAPATAGTEQRSAPLDLAVNDPWIWDYNKTNLGDRTGPTSRPSGNGNTNSDNEILNSSAVSLAPPIPDPPGGTYELTTYPITVSLTNPNNEEISISYYRIGAGAWVQYTGAFSMDPGQSLVVQAVSLAQENYSDSPTAVHNYLVTPVIPSLDVVFAKSSYNYLELGGATVGLNATAPANPGSVTLANEDEIPALYATSSNFRLYYTYDGSDPLTSPTAVPGPNFTGSFGTQQIPLNLASFGGNAVLNIRTAIKSFSETFISNSPIVETSLSSSKLPLPPPNLSTDPSGSVLMAHDSIDQVAPGNNIFYAEGQDPGTTNGQPSASAFPYAGPIAAPSSDTDYVARDYPQASLTTWWEPSSAVTLSVSAPIDGSFYAVGGNNRKIYKFDPTTARNTTIPTDAPFDVESLAVDSANAKIYYVEQASSNWRLGVYTVSTDTHEIYGSLTQGGFYDPPQSQPRNLMFFNGALYFIEENSDNLVKIELNPTGLRQIFRASDITNDSAVFTGIGDLAASSDGILYFSSTQGVYRYDLKRLTDLIVLQGAPGYVWTGLATNPGGLLVGVRSTEPGKLYQINTSNGTSVLLGNYLPVRNFYDFASAQAPVQVEPAGGQHYFVTPSSNSIRRLEIATGRNYVVTTALPMQPNAIAIDRNTATIYTIGLQSDTEPTGPILLVRYSLSGDSIAVMGNLAANSLSYALPNLPNCMTFFQGDLYTIPHASDNLVKITYSGDTLTNSIKVSDITNNTQTWTDPDALTIGPDGWLYISRSDANLLARYEIKNLANYTVIKNNYEANYVGLTFDPYGVFYGILATQNRKLYTLDDTNGNYTYKFTIQPEIPILDISGIFDFAPPPLVKDYFFTTGASIIYRYDPDSGLIQAETTAPYNVDNIAYDSDNGRIYYMQVGGYDLGYFDVSTRQHNSLDVANPSWGQYVATERFNNLVCFNGSLYFIANGTDDLVKIELTQSPSISTVFKFADISNDAQNFGIVGDLSVDNNGIVYISSPSYFASYDMKSRSDLQIKATNPTTSYEALFFATGGTLHGARVGNAGRFREVVLSSGAGINPRSILPYRYPVDAAGPSSRVPVAPTPGIYYFASPTCNTIHEISLTTGEARIINYSAPFNLETIAYDAENKILYYTQVQTTSGDGSQTGVAKYEVTLDRHTYLGNLSTFNRNKMPKALIFYSGGLYYVEPGTDDLIKVSLTATGLTSASKVSDITNNASNLGNLGAMAVDQNGVLYMGGSSSSLFAKYDLPSLSGYQLISTSSSSKYFGLVFDASNVLSGFPTSNNTQIHTVNPANGTRTFRVNAGDTIIDIAGTNSSPLVIDGDYYGVDGTTTIYKFDPDSGRASSLNSAATYGLYALARDPQANILYYIESSGSTWRLGKFDLPTSAHTILGNVSSVGTVPSALPQNLFFYNGSICYIAPNSDDLIVLTLNAGQTSLVGQYKLADITGNTISFPEVGDVTVDNDGIAYATSSDGRFFTFSMKTLGQYSQLASAIPNYRGLFFDNFGGLYGAYSTDPFKIYSLNKANGDKAFASTTNPNRGFVDMAGRESSGSWAKSESMWAIADDSSIIASIGLPARLIEFRNYRTPSVQRIDWGPIKLPVGTTFAPAASGSGLESMAISDGGAAYLVRNGAVTIGGITYNRPLLTIDIQSQASGTDVVAQFVGDLDAGLGSLGAAPTDAVSGVTISNDGQLYGTLTMGSSVAVDKLFRVANFLKTPANQIVNVIEVGNIAGGISSSTGTGDLAFAGGTLYVADRVDGSIYEVDPLTGVITSVFSSHFGANCLGLAVDPVDFSLAVSNGSGSSPNSVRRVIAGLFNDITYFDYNAKFGYSDIGAVAFYNGAFSPDTSYAPYFAVNRTKNIYAVNPSDGKTTLVTSKAPFTLDAITYDKTSGSLYYIENTSSNVELGRYTAATDTHEILANLDATPGPANPFDHPQHLVFYDNAVYFINRNTDDLIKVSNLVPGATVSTKVGDLNGNAGVWTTVQAAALDDAGMLYFGMGSGFYKYNLRLSTGFQLLSNTFTQSESILFDSTGMSFYGASSALNTRIDSLNETSSNYSLGNATTPSIQLYDMAGGNSAPSPPDPSAEFFAIGGSSRNIYTVNILNGQVSLLDGDSPSLSGVLNSIAYNPNTGLIYYTDVMNTGGVRLYSYNRLTDTHTLIGNVTSRPSGEYSATAGVANLACINNDLYYVHRDSDDLVRIRVSATSIVRTEKVTDLSRNTVAIVGDVGDLTVKVGWLHLTANAKLYKYNLDTWSGFSQTPNTSSLRNISIAPNGELVGNPNGGPTSLHLVNATSYADAILATTSPSLDVQDFAWAEESVPELDVGQHYMITSAGNTINRLDPSSGHQTLVYDSLPGQATAIALDSQNFLIYNLCTSGTASVLTSYNLQTEEYKNYGSIMASTLVFPATAAPQALLFSGGKLYFFNPGSDDLVEITVDATTIISQVKVGDLGGASLGVVESMALDTDGTVYLGTNAPIFAKFSLAGRNGFQIIDPTPGVTLIGLTAGLNRQLYGSVSSNPAIIYSVAKSSGIISVPATLAPATTAVDISGPSDGNVNMGIGNLVYKDLDISGGFSPGEGINGVSLQLFLVGDNPATGVPLATQSTSGGGKYLFSNLRPGSYFVHIPASQFAPGAPLAGSTSLPGNGGDGVADDNVDENGIDNASPAVNGIRSNDIELTILGEPGPGVELGFDNDSDDANELNFDITVDFGFTPSPQAAPYYGVNGTNVIYTLDPATGDVTTLTTTPTFSLAAIAHDSANNVLYCVENSDSNTRLGKYTISSNTWVSLGNLKASGFAYTMTTRPQHLVFYNGALYYVHPNTDDLVRITISSSAITAQANVADLNRGLSLGLVSAAALNDTGHLYFSSRNSLSRIDLRSLGSLETVNANFAPFDGLMWYATASKLAGVSSGSPYRIDLVSTSDGAVTRGVNTRPTVNFTDVAKGVPLLSPSAEQYYACNNTTTLYTVDPSLAANNRTALPATLPFNAGSLAYDQNRRILYYLEAAATTTSVRLGMYDVQNNVVRSLGDIAHSSMTQKPGVVPQHLAFFNGDLYYVNYHSSTTATRDDLIRVRVSDYAVLSAEKIADINGNSTLVQTTASTVDGSGYLYLFGAGAVPIRRYDLKNQASTTQTLPIGGTAVNVVNMVGAIWQTSQNRFVTVPNSNKNSFRYVATNGTVTTGNNVNATVTNGLNDLASGNSAAGHGSQSVPMAYIVGDFSSGTNYKGLARLRSDGTLDPSFVVTGGANAPVRDLLRQSNGGLIATGEFSDWGGTSRTGMARLDGSGTLDTTFNPRVYLTAGAGIPLGLDWAGWGTFVQNATPLAGTDTNTTSRDAYYGLSTSAGGVSGFSSQAWNNIGGTGVNMTLYYSQNMVEDGGPGNGTYNGPDLTGPTAGYTGGIDPDRGVMGDTSLRINNDRTGSATPVTVVASFSEPVYLNQLIVGGLSSRGVTPTGSSVNRLSNPSFETGSTYAFIDADISSPSLPRTISPGATVTWPAVQFDPAIIGLAASLSTNHTSGSSSHQINKSLGLPDNGSGAITDASYVALTGISPTDPLETYQVFTNGGVNTSTVQLTAAQSELEVHVFDIDAKGSGATIGDRVSIEALDNAGSPIPHAAWSVVISGDLTSTGSNPGSSLPPTVAYDAGGTKVNLTAATSFSYGDYTVLRYAGATPIRSVRLVADGTLANTTSRYYFTVRAIAGESGWLGNSFFPNATHATKAPSTSGLNSTGMEPWTLSNTFDWIQDSTRARHGSRFVYVRPGASVQCLGRSLSVGTGQTLEPGKCYEFSFDCASFNKDAPAGGANLRAKPRADFMYQNMSNATVSGSFALVEKLTGASVQSSPCTSWDALAWRTVTATFVCPSTFDGNFSFFLCQDRGSDGLLIDNVRLSECTAAGGAAYENSYVRAFTSADATGSPVAADLYGNLSARTEVLLGGSGSPQINGALTNVRMDTNASDNVYHTIGVGAETDGRYGRANLAWTSTPVRSVAITTWASRAEETAEGRTVPRLDGSPTSDAATILIALQGMVRAAAPAGSVYSIKEQSDGKLLIAGRFAEVNGVARNNLARLNPDGSLDASFNPGQGPDNTIYTLALGSSNAIYAGGIFGTWNGQTSGRKIARVTSSGSRDTAFSHTMSSGSTDLVYWLDASGSNLLVGGKFTGPGNGIARLTSSGAADSSFTSGNGANGLAVYSGTVLPNGKIMIGGDFATVGTTARSKIALLNTNGTVDTAWNPGTGLNSTVHAVSCLVNSTFTHVGGAFSTYQSATRNKVAVLGNADASPGLNPWGPATTGTGVLTITRIWGIR